MRMNFEHTGGLAFTRDWSALGPFQIGTREALWGCDPLAAFGGFSELAFDIKDTYPSSISPNGLVGWTLQRANVLNDAASASASLEVAFPSTEWSSLRDCYGRAACQYQAWVRGAFEFGGTRSRSLAIYTDQILELAVDGNTYFGGDLFVYRRAPLLLNIAPGQHTIEIRLIRDARAMGVPDSDPILEAKIDLLFVDEVHINETYTIIPDIINSKFASRFGSISIDNAGSKKIEVTAVNSVPPDLISVQNHGITVEPGQSKPVSLDLSSGYIDGHTIELIVVYRLQGSHDTAEVRSHALLRTSKPDEVHKVTYLHPSNIVSYGMLRPPKVSKNGTNAKLPVLLNLHGAGLDAASPQLANSMNDIADLPVWFLFPSGVTTWSSDDWHHWGWRDIEGAISSIPRWILENTWNGPDVDTDHLVVVGHSNGGQGTYYALTHWPDRIVAAVSASGYLSVQSYVPFQWWRETDPFRMAVVQAASNNFRHELLVPNLKDIPIYLQHGSVDDNVPVYHSRRLYQLLSENGIQADYSEVPQENHWWDGALVTPGIQKFLRSRLERIVVIKDFVEFSFVVADPADCGSKHGLKIRQLMIPGRVARVDVAKRGERLLVRTSNVKRMSLPILWARDHLIHLDDQSLSHMEILPQLAKIDLVKTRDETWTISSENQSLTGQSSSGGLTSESKLGGGLHAILRTERPFTILFHDDKDRKIALDTARNLYQYFAAQVHITSDPRVYEQAEGNTITIGIGDSMGPDQLPSHPLHVDSHRVIARTADGKKHIYDDKNNAVGAVFLRPRPSNSLELVVWGSDHTSLEIASRLVPKITGAGQADFVILGTECRWKGIDGTLGLGFFDEDWSITSASFLT